MKVHGKTDGEKHRQMGNSKVTLMCHTAQTGDTISKGISHNMT